ncbi:MAG: hypothetical protein LBD23_03345 [Oscillospiraceae bacterium]|jgi:hypothetical protein|nr:hypothetical protein [Oscillospiraceae bacterium]
MQSNYKQTFDAVNMSQETQKRIRSELSARFIENHKEDNIVSIKSRSTKKIITGLVAAVVVLSLTTVVAFAYGSQIIELLGGGHIEIEKSGNSSSVSMTISEADPDPVEVKDGRVYFILDGSNKDITEYCTESTYYQYEYIAENGYHHVFIVGGSPDNLGWAEFIWSEDGNILGSSAVFPPSTDMDQKPLWWENANETLRFLH